MPTQKKTQRKQAPKKGGRGEHKPTAKDRKVVEMMAAVVTQAEIAIAFGLSEKTLRKHYRDELDRAEIRANVKVGANLFRMACGTGREAVTAAIFWMKTRARWSEYGPPKKTPAPPPRSPKPLGKKAQADVDAGQPPQDQDWADLVPGGRA